MAQVRQAAAHGGWLAYHTYSSKRSDPGFPDLVLLRGSVLLFVELKSIHGRVSPAQAEWIERLNAVDGIEAMVVRGSDETEALCRRLMAR